jgi:hypothetical protein
LNIKPCMGQISRTWELILCHQLFQNIVLNKNNLWIKQVYHFIMFLLQKCTYPFPCQFHYTKRASRNYIFVVWKCTFQCILFQGSPHIVKTGRLDFSLSWIMGEVMENLGDFRKSIQILTFLSLTTACSPTFLKTNVLHKDLEKHYWKKATNFSKT